MKNFQTDSLLSLTRESRYGRIAQVYEYGAKIGSNGKIQKSKHFHLDFMEERSKVLYPGPGWGLEVKEATKRACVPTIVELDEKMLAKSKKIFHKSGVIDQIECIHGDVLKHQRPNYYDFVVANYFLDVFPKKTMIEIFKHLVSLLKPGGKVFLSGYAPLMGSNGHRLLQWANHLYANFFCKMVVNNAFHEIYNYEDYYNQLGLIPCCNYDFTHFDNFGPRFHRVWMAKKVKENHEI